MCNPYSSTKNEAHLQLRRAAIAIANLFTRYNVAPNTRAPVVILNACVHVSYLRQFARRCAQDKKFWRNHLLLLDRIASVQ